LGGVIVADDASVDPRERIFVIGLLRKVSGEVSEIAVLNGRSWPLTERFRHAVGDTVRWRVVNLSHVAHAMHLHGFYFNVESTGDGMSDTRSMEGGSRGVTARVPVGGTFAMSWIPDRSGNWLFHCHMLEHMLPDAHDGPAPAYHGPDTTAAGMAGLVLGVRVTGPEKRAAIPDNERRKFQLSINPDTRLGDVPSFKVDISEAGVAALRVNERAAPGPILVVTRGPAGGGRNPESPGRTNRDPLAWHRARELRRWRCRLRGLVRQRNAASGPSWVVHGEIHSTARRYLHLPHTLA
jgi:hypothetical protein